MAGSRAANYFHRLRSISGFSSLFITPQILVILAVATLLRLYLLRQPYIDAFSWRQSSTAMIAENYSRNGWNIFYPEVSWSGPGPSYQGREFQTVSFIAALLYEIVGKQDFVGRAVAVMFGALGIFALYQLVRRVWDERRATATAAVMAVLPGSVFIERSFLPDAAMVALVTTSFWLLVEYLKTERRAYLLLAGVIGAWGFCTKLSGLIVGLPMAYAIIAMTGKKRLLARSRLAAIGLFALLALAPVIAYYLWARHLAASYPPYHFAGSGNWLWDDGARVWWDQGYFLTRLGHNFNGWIWTLPVIILVLIALFLRPEKKQLASELTRGESSSSDSPSSDSPGAPWLFHWWILASIFFYIIGAKELVNNPWNFHIINPAAAALAATAILWIANRVKRVTHPLASPAIIILLFAAIVFWGQKGLSFMYYPYAGESREMGLALRQVTEPGALVVTMANDPGDPVAIYYSRRRGWVFPPARPGKAWGVLPEDDNESITLFEELRAGGAGWLGIVEKHMNEMAERHPRLALHIQRTCELKQANSAYTVYRILNPGEIAEHQAFR